ncbi:MAG TPA: fimbria/pilus outer membrane usher protein [Gallionellaceae bacterium]
MHQSKAHALAVAIGLAAMLGVSGPLFAQTATGSSSGAASGDRLIPLEVVINNTEGGQWVLLERNGALYAPEEAFEEWRLNRHPDTPVVDYRGQKWIPLSSAPGFEARFDYANQSVELVFSPQAFAATRLTEKVVVRPELTPATPAAFLNYDLSYTSSAYQDAPGNRELGALTELGLSAGGGVLTSSFVGHNLTSDDSSTVPSSWVRLETVYSRDFLDSNTTLRLGDSTTRRGSWGRPVYFGGLQLGRNFALTPGFISQPIPILSGTSGAPSTVELYVNDVLRQTSNVPSGPFTIDNFPLLTGSGDARIVVRDVLGRETVLDQPFFTHTSLLEQGLTDWSGEVGAVRNNLGISSADYGQRFASGMIRHGLSKSLTLEAQGEIGQSTQNLGLGAAYALPFQALGQAALSASQDQTAGAGTDWVLGVQRSSLHHGYSARIEGASVNYRQLGLSVLPYRMQISGNYTYTSDYSGSLGMAFARIATYDQGELTTFSGNYSTRVFNKSALTFTASRVVGSEEGYSFVVSLLMPLDNRINVTSNLTRRAGQTEGYVSASKNLGYDTGTGWRTLAGNRAGQNYGEGGFYYQGDKGLLTSDMSASAATQTVRLGAQGGLVAMDGHMFMSRRIQDSFALVEVPGYADVGVGFQGSVLTHTDKDGVALLPRLLPYQRNSVRLDPTELPISAELDSIEQVVIPPARSGVKVVFPVRSGRGALIHIKLENGEDAPAGAAIELVGDKEEFFVARRGEAFITGLQDKNTLRMRRNDNICSFEVRLPPGNPDDIPRIGPVTCVTQQQESPKEEGVQP